MRLTSSLMQGYHPCLMKLESEAQEKNHVLVLGVDILGDTEHSHLTLRKRVFWGKIV